VFESATICPTTVSDLDDVLSQADDEVINRLINLRGDTLVLGAGGKMGYHLARMLKSVYQSHGRPDRVIAVSRFTSSNSRTLFERDAISTIQADLSDQKMLASLPDAPNIFFLAGVKFGTTQQPDLLRKMNQEMPLSVAERFSDSRIVAMSTGCVYSFTDVDSGGSKETDSMNPPGEYAQSCIAREKAFEKVSQEVGTAVSIVRLNYSIDLRYGVLVDIARSVKNGEPIDLTTGYVNIIWQRDAISQILQSWTMADSPAWIGNVTGAETVSVRKLAEEFAKKMQKKVRFTGSESTTCWLSNSEKARTLFGEPPMPLTRMMDWIVSWISREMPTMNKPTHFQTRDGNY